MWFVALNLTLLFVSIVFALWRGGPAEKSGALVLIAMEATDLIGHAILGRTYTHIDPTALVVDLVGLVAFTGIALHSLRFWPLWASSLQLLSASAHLIRLIDFHAGRLTYALMKTGPTQAVILILLVATYRHTRKAGATGSDRS